MADTLSLLFELDTDPAKSIAGFQRARVEFAREIAAMRKLVAQSFTLPSIKLPTAPTATRSRPSAQADDHVKEFRRIEAEAKKSANAQEREQRRLTAAVQSLQRQRSAAIIAGFKAEERAAIASARAQERAARQAAQSISNAFRGIGSGLQSVGRTLTVGITAPLAALGAISLKSAKDLDANVNTLKAFTGSAEAAERRLAQLIKTARDTPGLTTNLALTLDAQLRVAQTTEETINRVLPAIGRLNAVSKLPDTARFTQNLLQLVTQNFERQDLKELVGQSPLAGQLLTEIFNVDSPTNAAAIRASAQKLGLTTVDAFFTAFAEAAAGNQGLATVTESIGTRFEKIADRVSVALRPLGLAIINAIEPFVEPVASLIERLGAAFNSLSQPVKTAIIVIAGIAAAAGPVLFVLGGIATGIAGVVSAIGTIAAAVAAVGLPVIIAVIAAIVVEIGKWVVILGVLGLAWKTNFLGIRELVTDAASAVVEAFTRIKTIITEATDRILPTLQSITTKVVAAITIIWERYGKQFVAIIGTAFRIATTITEAFLRTFADFVDLVLKLIDGNWQGAWSAFARIVIRALEGLSAVLDKLPTILARAFLKLNQLILAQAGRFATAGQDLALKLVASLATKLIESAPKIRAALIDMFTIAALGLDLTTVGAVMAGKAAAALKKAAGEGIAIPVMIEEQGLARIRLNPDGSVKTDSKRPPPSTPTDGDGKGADAETRRRIRLLELEAEKAEAIARQGIAAENILFEQRRTSLKEFTAFQLREEEFVLAKKKQVFAAERAEAEKLTKGRDLALGEIRLKELKADLDFADRKNQILANQEREELEAAKAHRQVVLDIHDEGDQKQLQLIDSYVERYLLSYEEAEKRRLAIEEKARDRRRTELETQLGEAGQNVEEQQRIKDAIAKLDAESATAREEAENRKRAALRATLEAELDYYQTLQQIRLRATQLLRDAADIELGGLIRRFGDRRKFRLRALELERQDNENQHQENLRQIEQEKRDAEKRLEGVRDAEEKLLALRRYYAELERAENQRRATERRDEEDREAEERDPFSSLRKRFENFKFDIENTNDAITDSIGSLAEQVNASLGALADGFRQGVVAYILYGESIGKALKAALAQQLAAISAEALIQSLKHAAYALGSLAFGNAAAAAKHAAAAAAFGALALATGLAGRALAKSSGLFDRGRSSGTASAGVSGSNEPRNREFQSGAQGVEPSSIAAREGSSGSIFGRLAARLEAFTQQNMEMQRQQMLVQGQTAQALARIQSMRHGDALAIGAAENPAAVGRAVINTSNSDGEFNEAMQRNLGFAR